VTAVRHVLELLGVAAVLAGPVPICLAIARADAGLAARLLTTLVAWCALQAGVALGLALAGWLTPGPLLVVQLALLAIGLAAEHRAGPLPRPTPPLEPAEWITIAALAILGTTLLLHAMLHPIKEHDSLDYHLPALARWVHAGAMVPVERIHPNGRYPYGWELLSALLVVPLREDVFVSVPNLIAWSILGLAVHGLARAVGRARSTPWRRVPGPRAPGHPRAGRDDARRPRHGGLRCRGALRVRATAPCRDRDRAGHCGEDLRA
jgi:hypothetical protein